MRLLEKLSAGMADGKGRVQPQERQTTRRRGNLCPRRVQAVSRQLRAKLRTVVRQTQSRWISLIVLRRDQPRQGGEVNVCRAGVRQACIVA